MGFFFLFKIGISLIFFEYNEYMGFVFFRNKVFVFVDEWIKICIYSYFFLNFIIFWGIVCKICFYFDVSIKYKIEFIVVVDLFKEIKRKVCEILGRIIMFFCFFK